jgi:hypothetical protein
LESDAVECGRALGAHAGAMHAENALYGEGIVNENTVRKAAVAISSIGSVRAVNSLYGSSFLSKYISTLENNPNFKNSGISSGIFKHKDRGSKLTSDEVDTLASDFFNSMRKMFVDKFPDISTFLNEELFSRYQDENSAFGSDAMKFVRGKYQSIMESGAQSADDMKFLYAFDPQEAQLTAVTDGLVDDLISHWTQKRHYNDKDGNPRPVQRKDVVPTIVGGLMSVLETVSEGTGSTSFYDMLEVPKSSPVSVNLPEIPELPSMLTAQSSNVKKFASGVQGSAYAFLQAAVAMFNDIVEKGGSGIPSAGRRGESSEIDSEETIGLVDMGPGEETISLTDTPASEETVQLR